MRILADTNVPGEHVLALRADGHEVVYSRDVDELGPRASDASIVEYAETNEYAVLSTDLKDFSDWDASVPVLVAQQYMSGSDVCGAVARIVSAPFDPAEADPIWLSNV